MLPPVCGSWPHVPGLLCLLGYARPAAPNAVMLARQVHRCIDLNPLQFFRVAPAAGARGDEGGAAAAPAGRKGMLKVPSLLFDIEVRACAELASRGISLGNRGAGVRVGGRPVRLRPRGRLPGRTGAGGSACVHPVE